MEGKKSMELSKEQVAELIKERDALKKELALLDIKLKERTRMINQSLHEILFKMEEH